MRATPESHRTHGKFDFSARSGVLPRELYIAPAAGCPRVWSLTMLIIYPLWLIPAHPDAVVAAAVSRRRWRQVAACGRRRQKTRFRENSGRDALSVAV